MFGRAASSLTMQDVSRVMLGQGFDSEFQNVQSEGKVGRIAAARNGVNFFVNFLGNSERFGCVNFFTVVDNEDGRDASEVNQFNEAMRSAKVVSTGNSLCLVHDFVVPKAGLNEELFLANLEFWNFAMSEFGKWYLGR